MDIKKNLEKLGYTANESDVYVELLKIGESSVGSLIENTGLHRELVYGALKRLEQYGLVQSLEKKKIRHYQVINPATIAWKAVEKARLAQEMIPTLNEMYNQPQVIVRIYEGSEGFEEMENDWGATLKDNEDFYCIGGAGDAWYQVTNNFYKKYHSRLLKRGIHLKTVTFKNEAKEISKYENPAFNPVRILPDKFKVPSSTVIYGDKIAIQVFGERPIAIVIQSKSISTSYRQYFELLWSLGK